MQRPAHHSGALSFISHGSACYFARNIVIMPNDTAKSTLLLDGQQAIAEMDKLIAKNKELKAARDKALLSNDLNAFKKFDAAVKENEKSIRSFRKATFDTEAVLKNLNGSTLKDLEKTYRTLKERMGSMTRGTEEWKKSSEDLSKVRSEIDSVKTGMGEASTKTSGFAGAWKMVGGAAAFASGIFASLYGVINTGAKAIQSSEVVSDRWAKTTAGLSSGWNVFLNSLATWNWDGFLQRMRDAVSAGREYAEVLDLMEDRTRGLTAQHKLQEAEIAKLQLAYWDHNKTAEEKAEIQKKVRDLTAQMREEDKKLAEQNYAALVKNLVDNKKINASALESFILFKGQTEEKVQLVQKLIDAENTYNNNVGFLGKDNKVVADAYKTMIELRVKGVGKYKDLLKSLGPEEIKQATDLFNAVSDAQTAYYTDQANATRKMEQQEGKQEKINERQINSANELKDATVDAFTEIKNTITDLDAKINEAVVAKDLPLVKKLTLEKEAAEYTLASYEALKDSISKGYYDLRDQGDVAAMIGLTATNVMSSNKPGGLTPRKVGATGPSEADQAREEADAQRREDWRDAEFAIAEDLNNTITNMVLAKQQAQLDHKLSMLNAEKEAELSQKNLTEQQKAEIEKRYNEKARKLKREQWIKERNATAISTIVQTALAVMKAAPNVALQVATGIAGALAVTEIMAQPVPEFSRGRYNVTGVSGRQYNADYAGRAVTGLYTRPALVAETGAELIVDPATTRNLQMNFPGVMEAISAARVPQYADGRYPSATASPGNVSLQDGGFVSAVGEFKQVVAALMQYGIRAKVSLNDLEDVQEKRDTIEAATEM